MFPSKGFSLLVVFLVANFKAEASFFVNQKSTDGNGSITKRIVGGVEVVPFEYPWLVGLIQETKDSDYSGQFCGGTLIAPNWVLTAGHCVCPIRVSLTIRVILKRHRLSKPTEGGETHSVDRIICHPNYNDETLDYDVALLRLKTRSSVDPVVMISNTTIGYEASPTMLTVAGWGKLNYNQYADTMHKVQVPIILHDTCSRLYLDGFGRSYVTQRMICAGYLEGKKDACQGDSGGPLFHVSSSNQITLVGVVSWGDGCAERNKPGVYSRVSYLRPWITSTMDTCCSDRQFFDYAGTIISEGQSITIPSAGTMVATKSGTIAVGLKGPRYKDFDLLLQTWRSTTDSWTTVAWSEAPYISVEQLSRSLYTGDKFRVVVRADTGTGPFEVQIVGLKGAEFINDAPQSASPKPSLSQSLSRSSSRSLSPKISTFTRIIFQTDYASFIESNSTQRVAEQLASVLNTPMESIEVLSVSEGSVLFDFRVKNSTALSARTLHIVLSDLMKHNTVDLGFPVSRIQDSNGVSFFEGQPQSPRPQETKAYEAINISDQPNIPRHVIVFLLVVGSLAVVGSVGVMVYNALQSRFLDHNPLPSVDVGFPSSSLA
eukprot:TRINITY_DN8301_c0_g1_i1.p1 TRINITY_DN8301_c0_g1~~TRINITY_DN8301_c0_g1_i1.p1  ORF type:complete len:601 (+),score=89.26 TRINITY_DN8301_c0_g1_i1:81-1883(+)